ncbi:hypothetical protein [Alkalihalobacillus sp. R86527]|uniref:hypothetical protein n=1 Tax=Alkalihalobacillus sp. R86527 TaxID=3093863 RepID=UPI00366CDB26
MIKQTIYDFKASVPTSGSETLNRNIPTSPSSIKLAQFGLYVPAQADFVQLHATVGVRATALNPTVLFKVFRDTGVIFSTRHSLDLDLFDLQTVSFQVIDDNPPAGAYSYYITAELDESIFLDSASVVGPITFTGYSIGKV